MDSVPHRLAPGKEERFADPEVEAALLGDLLLSPDATERVLSLGITGATFTDPRHRAIFRAILDVRASGLTPDIVTVAHRLREQGDALDTLVSGLPGATPTSALAEDHALLLVDLQRRREWLLKVRGLERFLAQPDLAPEALVEALAEVGALYDALEDHVSSRAHPAGPDVLSLADLLATPEPHQWYAAAPLVPHPGVTLIVGSPGTFKTWLSCDLALALAEGRPFLGRFGVARPLQTLFIEAEMGRDQVARRFRLLGAGPACDRLHVVIGPLDLYGAAQRDWVLRRDEEVVIIDPARRLFRGDENASGDVARFFKDAVFPLVRAGKSVVLIHHVRKAIPGQPLSDPDAMIRGSGDWAAAVDSALVLARQDEQRVLVRQVKLRDDREVAPFLVRLEIEDGRARLLHDGDAESRLPGLRPVRESLLEALGDEMRSLDDVLGELRGRYSERVVRETFRALEAEGVIERVRAGRRVFYAANGKGHRHG